MGRVGLISHPSYLEHEMGAGHPECPERLRAILAQVQSTGTWKDLVHLEPSPATSDWIETVHDPSYLERLRERSPSSGYASLDPDTTLCPGSLGAALLAAGGAMFAVDAIMNDQVDHVFCAVRPPGHHAESNRAMGFCFFNNVAIAARYIQKQYGLQRILIVDWDVHHGNGTQHTFYDDPSVLFFSTHQFPHYPGTGNAKETGGPHAIGKTINIPMSSGGGNEAYQAVFEEILIPAADEFSPEFVLISAGFDAHRDDPLAGMQLTEEGFGALTEIVKRIATRHAKGRIVSCLEGGYHLPALAKSVDQHLQCLLKP